MLPKKGKMLHLWVGISKSPKDYAELIAKALKMEHGDTHRSVKTIMRWTDASERSVKNWLAGEVGPSGYFLMRLLIKSEAVRALVLALMAGETAAHSAGQGQLHEQPQSKPRPEGKTTSFTYLNGDIYGDIYGDIDVTVKTPSQVLLNARQEWFLDRVAKGQKCLAEDIAAHWHVALRTAKRDIANLRECGRIRFEGPQRSGHYLLIE